MRESDRAIALECLVRVEETLLRLRDLRAWWRRLGPTRQAEFKEFLASVMAYRNALIR